MPFLTTEFAEISWNNAK